jgi:hypothetical protein
MPRVKTPRPDPDAIFIGWQGAAAEIDGVPHSVAAGERRLGSDLLLQNDFIQAIFCPWERLSI